MSIRLEMLRTACLAPQHLGESSGLVRDYFLREQNDDGGFKNRSGRSDLYYTVFGLEGLIALHSAQFPVGASDARPDDLSPLEECARRAEAFLGSFGGGEQLDFVHLCCLARAWAAMVQLRPASGPRAPAAEVMRPRIESFRAGDGGYHPEPGQEHGTAYGCFLALGACQDLGLELPHPTGLVKSLARLKVEGDAYTNYLLPHSGCELRARIGSTNATAAAVAVLRHVGQPVSPATGQWLLEQCHPQGGFLAMPNAPLPDLLSTATALHALAGLGVPYAGLRETCLDFLDSLWTNEGAFHGHWCDDKTDLEYAFYGLLALGCLKL